MDGRLKAQVVAVAGPLVVLLGVRVLLSPGPVSAGVVQQEPRIIPVSAPVAKPTPEQERVVNWCAAQDVQPGGSPFTRELFPRAASVGPQPQVGPAEEIHPAAQETLPADLRVSAVLGTTEGGVAIIGGKMYKPGQEVRPGLRVMRIDARASRVQLTDSQGRVWVLNCEK